MKPPVHKPGPKKQPGEIARGSEHPGWMKGYVPDPFDPAYYRGGRLTGAGILDLLFWYHLKNPDHGEGLLPGLDDVRERLCTLLPTYPDYKTLTAKDNPCLQKHPLNEKEQKPKRKSKSRKTKSSSIGPPPSKKRARSDKR